MKVGILGSGQVAQALGHAFAKRGHDVMIGSRDPKRDDVEAWVRENAPHAHAGTSAEAARHGDVIVLATAWEGTRLAIENAGPENARGKLVIDVTNPLDHGPDGPMLVVGHTDSGGEQVQRWLPGARVVKCFNIINNQDMADPRRPATMFYCGDDEKAKEQVAGILREFGWDDAVDLGGLDGARYLEPLAMVWIRYGFLHDQWDHAIKLHR